MRNLIRLCPNHPSDEFGDKASWLSDFDDMFDDWRCVPGAQASSGNAACRLRPSSNARQALS